MFAETPLSAIPRSNWRPSQPKRCRFLQSASPGWFLIPRGTAVAVHAVQESILKKKLENMKTLPSLLKLFLPLLFVAIMPATTKAINPTAVATTTNVTIAGGTSYSFTVLYSDDGEIDVGSLDSGDVRVTGPVGFNVAATFVSVNINSNGTPRIATYSIVPPGGSWNFADNGTYTVLMQASQVFDGIGNAVAAGSI